MIRALSLALFALTGCGGSAFDAGLGAPTVGDDAPALAADAPEAGPAPESAPPPPGDAPLERDAGLADSPMKMPDEALGHEADASADAPVLPDRGAPGDDAAPDREPPDTGCELAAAGAGRCVGAPFDTPSSFCLATYQGPTPTGMAAPTPRACQCAGAYDCACLLAALPNVCPPSSTAHCLDTDAGPGVTCL